MITRAHIEKKIYRELTNSKFQSATLHFLDSIMNSSDPEKFLSVYELSLLANIELSDEEVLNLAFNLASLSIPLLEVIIEYENEFMEKDEVRLILMHEPIGHPLSGELVEFSDYKNELALYFKFNQELWRQLKSVK